MEEVMSQLYCYLASDCMLMGACISYWSIIVFKMWFTAPIIKIEWSKHSIPNIFFNSFTICLSGNLCEALFFFSSGSSYIICSPRIQETYMNY
jgi:hypothetical protein